MNKFVILPPCVVDIVVIMSRFLQSAVTFRFWMLGTLLLI